VRAATKVLLFGSQTRAQLVSALITSFAPVGWWSMRATSGTNEPNRGSAGSSADMTITSATLGQTGQLGANEAALMDGANSRYQAANVAALASLTTWEWVFLVNPSSAGEGNQGKFFCWGDGLFASANPRMEFNAGLGGFAISVFNTTPTTFSTTTSTGLSASAWALVFVAYDDVGDRKIHVRKGIARTVSEYAYNAQPPLTGTYRPPTSVLNLFNNSAQGATFAGLGDEAFVISGNLTPAQRTALVVATGV
jgi:hypothetical protein